MAITIDRAFPIGADPPDETVQVAGDTDWRELIHYLGCTSGVGARGLNIGNQFEVFGDSTNMTVKIKSGECYIRGTYGRNADQETLVLAGSAPPGGNSRISIVVLRLDIPNKRIQLHEIQGSNYTTTPSVPSLTQNSTIWDIPLARVTIPAGGVVAAGAVVDARLYARSYSGKQPGDIVDRPFDYNPPFGGLLTDGASVSRVTYAELAEIIDPGGTSATFALPDYRGEVLAAKDDMSSPAGDAGRLDASTTTSAGHYGAQFATTPSIGLGTLALSGGSNSLSVMQPTHLVYRYVMARPG